MAKYAPGGEMDRLDRTSSDYFIDHSYMYRNRTNEKTTSGQEIIKGFLIALVLIAAFELFAPAAYPEPMTLQSTYMNYTADYSQAILTFNVSNETVGFIINPTYTIVVTDDSGQTVYSSNAQTIGIMIPWESKSITAMAPAFPGMQYNIQLQCKTVKPV